MTDALLIIDIQRGLFEPEPRPFEADLVIARINALSARARQLHVPVFVIQHEAREDGVLFGSKDWQLVPSLVVADSDIRIRKTSPDSFLRTDLEPQLRMRGTKRVIACGYATEFCVDTTVRRAASLGLSVVLAADAHTTHDKPHASAQQIRTHHNATLPDISSFGVTITAEPSAAIAFH